MTPSSIRPRRIRPARAAVAAVAAVAAAGLLLAAAPARAQFGSSLLEAGKHDMVHKVLHDRLVGELRKVRVQDPATLAEALEHFALGQRDKGKEYLDRAIKANTPTQLRSAAATLEALAPALGPYAPTIQGAARVIASRAAEAGVADAPAASAPVASAGVLAPVAAPAAARPVALAAHQDHGGPNLGREGEDCQRSPDCHAPLGCVRGTCRKRSNGD